MESQTVNDRIIVYGTSWCPDDCRSKRFLDEHRVPYVSDDVEQDPRGEAYVRRLNGGRRVIPTIVFPGGSVLFEPSNGELAVKLGKQAESAERIIKRPVRAWAA